jgi:hypothetical protein
MACCVVAEPIGSVSLWLIALPGQGSRCARIFSALDSTVKLSGVRYDHPLRAVYVKVRL